MDVSFDRALGEEGFVALAKRTIFSLEELSKDNFIKIDFCGKGYYMANDFKRELACKIVAARGYERFESFQDAGFCWGAATKSSFTLDFRILAKICAENTLRVYNLIKASTTSDSRKMLVENIYHANLRLKKAHELLNGSEERSTRFVAFSNGFTWKVTPNEIYLE